jgi:hypothetical protein
MCTPRTATAARFYLKLLLLGSCLALCNVPGVTAQQSDPFATAGEQVRERTNGELASITPGTLDRLHAPLLRSDLQLLGAQSCAAASCHGGPQPGVAQKQVSRGSEYQLWLENDPHARSWQTISSQQSVEMMQRLKIMQGNAIVDQAGFDNCLACHNTTKRFDEPRSHVQRSEGVGCSGCHGPEQLWARSHYQWGFDALGAADIGFVANGDLLARARTCASCHVGDQDRDMNHDLIAAGHPPLRYEFATYHAWQPKHWRDAETADRTAYEAQLWLAGQIAAADAALSLLQARSGQRHSASQWPELAAYDCSSCHHSLGLNNARRTPAQETQLAIAPLSQWNFVGLQWLIEDRIQRGAGTADDTRVLGTLSRVREEMETAAIPDAIRVHAAVVEARRAIDAWSRSQSGLSERNGFRSDRLGRIAARAAGKTQSFDTWESTAQLYLALVAARESWPGGWSGQLYPLSEQLRRGLRFPELVNSPSFAISQPQSQTATRAQARQLALNIASYLGPITFDNRPLPEDDDFSPHQLRLELESSFREAAQQWQAERQQRRDPAVIAEDARDVPQADRPDSLPPPRQPGVDRQPSGERPERPPVPRITPEELQRRLQELERN